MNASSMPAAQLRQVHKHYGGVHALRGVDLRLDAGELLALLGSNGAGKSTAIALLLGLQRPDRGQALVFGQSPGTAAVRQRIGVMLQQAGIPEMLKVGEVLALTRRYYARPRSVADCVALAGLDGLLERRYGALSGGQQRRVQFALAICGRPQLLFLDEPTTGLDIDARQQLWQAIGEMRAQGCAVLLTTHYLEEAEALAQRVAVLQHGSIVADGSLDAVRARVGQARIVCRTRLAAQALEQWPGVRAVARRQLRLEIIVGRAEPVVARLLAEDPQLSELEVQRASLADALREIAANQPQEVS